MVKKNPTTPKDYLVPIYNSVCKHAIDLLAVKYSVELNNIGLVSEAYLRKIPVSRTGNIILANNPH